MKYKKIAENVAELVAEKNAAYGNSIAKVAPILELLYDSSISKEQYVDLHFIVRILDKFARISSGNSAAFNESPWMDICGYSLARLALEKKDE